MEEHRILVGDCVDMMRTLPDQSVHTCITSPPYFGLRDYGVDGQIGLESSPREFIDSLVAVFREVRRVLRNDGTLWLNMGDSYAGSWGAQGRPQGDGQMSGRSVTSARQINEHPRFKSGTGVRGREMGMKSKDLMGMPWRLAFALQDDGWYLRQDIIWHKPNPMPESVRDRCTKAHEYLFLLSKAPRYYFNQDPIREACSPNTHAKLSQDVQNQIGSARANGGAKTNGNMKAVDRKTNGVGWGHGTDSEQRQRGRVKDNASMDSALAIMPTERNKRSVWTVATNGFKGAHFATFPPDLIRPCVLAGSPRGGMVLDPFGGAGTTALVAMQEGRQSVICELNPEYAALARQRLDAARADGATQMDILQDVCTA